MELVSLMMNMLMCDYLPGKGIAEKYEFKLHFTHEQVFGDILQAQSLYKKLKQSIYIEYYIHTLSVDEDQKG